MSKGSDCLNLNEDRIKKVCGSVDYKNRKCLLWLNRKLCMSAVDIADFFNLNNSSIYYWFDKLNLKRKNKKSHREFVREIYNLFGCEYSILDIYYNSKQKVKIRHNKCGHIYKTLPSVILEGHGCKKCSDSKRTMSDSEFKKKVKDLTGKEYTPLDKYKTSRIKIKFKHNKCGHEWEISPNNFFRGKRCPKCMITREPKKHETFIEEVYKLVDEEYEILGEYKKAKTKIKIKHNTCGNVYEVAPDKFLRGRRCPECSLEGMKGENHPNWNPNLTEKERSEGRNYSEYLEWRKRVYERDNYTCQISGIRDGKINAHHLNDYANHPDQRVQISNGITLNVNVHKLFHKIYGRKSETTKENFLEFKRRYENGEFIEQLKEVI